jgi:hypothetical protein
MMPLSGRHDGKAARLDGLGTTMSITGRGALALPAIAAPPAESLGGAGGASAI